MPLTKTGTMLVKEAARWMDFVSMLGPEDIARLHKAGLIKPLEQLIAGINKGTENMLNLHNYKVRHKVGGKLWGENVPVAKTHPDQKLIVTDFENGPLPNAQDELLRALITRHEAYEMQAAERALRKYNSNPEKYGRAIIRNYEKTNPDEIGIYNLENLDQTMSAARKAKYNTPHTGFMVNDGKEKYAPNVCTGHLDLDVLFKERKLVDRFPYPQNPALQKIREWRHGTGEYQYLDVAGNLGDPSHNVNYLERFNKRNACSVLKYGKNPVIVNSGKATILEPLF